MNSKLQYLSEHLKSTRRKLDDGRHGGIVLAGEELDAFIDQVGEWIDMAVALENQISRTEWNSRAAAERAILMTPAGAAVLGAMRSDSNVVPFFRPRDGGPA